MWPSMPVRGAESRWAARCSSAGQVGPEAGKGRGCCIILEREGWGWCMSLEEGVAPAM